MEIMTDRDKDLFYSAVMLNTKLNYKTIKELQDLQLISNYRDISDKDILKRIAEKGSGAGQDTVIKIKSLLETYKDLEKVVTEYKRIADSNNIEVISSLNDSYPFN